MPTVTQWFDPKVDGQPVSVGWYERRLPGFDVRGYWNGHRWLVGQTLGESAVQDCPWRGLTEPNEEKQ